MKGKPQTEFLGTKASSLNAIFAPKTVAVIGATPKKGSVGRTIFWNLISNPFGGTVFPINPKRSSVLGIKAYPSIADISERIDLAIIVTPASSVLGVMRQCVASKVRGCIIISAGFKETGQAGADLEKEILKEARRGGIRVIGPNCLGVMNPFTGLNATFAGGMATRGNVAFISQSGALCTAVLDWSLREHVGFSAFVSIGSMLDVGWGDLIDYLSADPNTESILIYMESIGDARAFLSAAREVALDKPIIVLKAGRTEAAAIAAASHTGSLTGSDEVLDAAFRRSGVLRVNKIEDLFSMADVLAKQPRPKGNRLTIITNAGGPGVLAADVVMGTQGQLTKLSDQSKEELSNFLPEHWSHGNPVDILGDADPERYAKTLDVLAKDPDANGFLVILTPQAMSDPTRTAALLEPYAKIADKPVLASWMGGPVVDAGRSILNRANIPTFDHPDAAAWVFHHMWSYSEKTKSPFEAPILPPDYPAREKSKRRNVEKIIASARNAGQTILTEADSKSILEFYGIPSTPMRIAANEEEAISCARGIGHPVVLKLHSKSITHKTDVGGVKLNLRDDDAVRFAFRDIATRVRAECGPEHFLGVTVQPFVAHDGYEVIVGSSIDPQFGPVLLFGSGGQLVEIFKDRALGLPPLNTTLARRMIEQTRIFHALQGTRGRPPVDLEKLTNAMVLFSRLVVEQQWIKEVDINPLIVSPSEVRALDARIILHPLSVKEEQLPRLAIRPYPLEYVSMREIQDIGEVTIRPISPEDEPLMVQFHKTLSDRTVHLRFFLPLKLATRVAHDRLTRVCFNDYDRDIALIAIRAKPEGSGEEVLAVGRLGKMPGTSAAEFAILVGDPYQHYGLGNELMRRILDIARREGVQTLRAYMSPDNDAMLRICRTHGFKAKKASDEAMLIAQLELGA
jgi:acetyltransferase